VLERRAVQPQLGLLKSTMLQLDPAFSERAYGAGSFSDFVEKLKKADFINVSGSGGRYIIERRGHAPDKAAPKPEEALPMLRDMLETHRMELEEGALAEELEQWMQSEHPDFNLQKFGFQSFSEFLNYAQDKTVVRTEPDEERGLIVHLGAEFYPPALPERAVEEQVIEEEDEPQPIVEGQPTIFEPNPPPAKAKKTVARKRAATGTGGIRRPRKKRPE
jgi:hypothetical protein